MAYLIDNIQIRLTIWIDRLAKFEVDRIQQSINAAAVDLKVFQSTSNLHICSSII